MLQLVAASALGIAAASALFLAILVGRRVLLAGRAARRAEAHERLLPLALALADGEAPNVELGRRDQELLADTLGALARRVRGDSRERIAEYFRGSPALRHELAALSARSAWRRAEAAARLGDMGSATAAPALRDALDDDDRDVRTAVARSLGRLGDGDAAPALVQRLVDGRLPRASAAQALVTLGSEAVPELLPLVRHEQAGVRAVSIQLLGLLGSSEEAGVAEEALRDPAAEVRAAASGALARIGRPASAAPLRRALADRVPLVAAAAAEALGELGAGEAVTALTEMARGGGFDAARAAAAALARIDPDALRVAAAVPGAGAHLHEAADLLEV